MRVAVLSFSAVLCTSALFAQPTYFRNEKVGVLAGLKYGETSSKLEYTGKPPYLAVHFEGNPGDKVDIRVESINGQAMSALTDSAYKPIVSNFGSHITAVLPPGAEPYPNTYYVVLQEEHRNPATFTVTVQKTGAGPEAADTGYLSCTVDSECLAVPREGCCHNGYKDAVNKDRIPEYRQANACKMKNPMCPQFIVDDKRVALCNASSHQCEMVEPNTIRCGGTGEASHACPAGYTCKTTGTDIPGICAK
jgi:hypothetical protein